MIKLEDIANSKITSPSKLTTLFLERIETKTPEVLSNKCLDTLAEEFLSIDDEEFVTIDVIKKLLR